VRVCSRLGVCFGLLDCARPARFICPLDLAAACLGRSDFDSLCAKKYFLLFFILLIAADACLIGSY
jgi:hypothetical protein